MSPESKHILETLAPDEPVFILRGQDILAPRVVQQWIDAADALGVSQVKIETARQHLDAIIDWQTGGHRVKVPD